MEDSAGGEPVGGMAGDGAAAGDDPVPAGPGPGRMVRPRPGRRGAALPVAAVALALAALAGAGTSLALASSPPAAAAAPSTCSQAASRLTLSATATATAAPGVVTVTLAAGESEPSAAAALSSDDATTAAVVAALRRLGVPPGDIQTSGLSLQPQYAFAPSGGPRLTGYQATDSLTVTLRDLSTAGTAIDAAARAAGNGARISSLAFAAADPTALQDRARSDAVRQATAHARTLAQAAGERLGPLCSLTDDTVPTVPQVEGNGFATAAPSRTAAVPLAAGTVQQTATVKLVYAVTPA